MKKYKAEFLSLLRNYQGIIHKVNLIYFTAPEDREDNFQEVVYHLWKAYPHLKNKEKVASWIYAIAINTSISKIRKDSHYIIMDQANFPEIPSTAPTAEEDLDFQHLLESIRHLKEIDRSILLLYLEEYSYNEIAEITGLKSSNVGARISRAKKELEKILKIKTYGH